MAREPRFVLNNSTYTASMTKVDRDKLYGWTKKVYTDSQNQPCTFLNLLDDGRTLVGTGGVSLKTVDESGNEVSNADLKACYADGSEAMLMPSVFDTEIFLDDSKTLNDFLDLEVKSVYQLDFADQQQQLCAALQQHKILHFYFNYRAGYEADDAFLIEREQVIFALVGKVTQFNYSSLAVANTVVDDEAEESSDEIDFNMF